MPKKKTVSKSVRRSADDCPTAWEQLNTITPVSKALAFFLFLTLPVMAFYFGALYQDTFSVLEALPLM